jgi:CBS domain-containing protein
LGVDNKRVFAGRLLRLALTDENGAVLGRVEDVVVAPAYADKPPRVLGFVANLQRRHIFVNAGRVGSIGHTGVCLQGGTVDLRHFQARPGETLVSQLLGRRIDDEVVMDISLQLEPPAGWTVEAVALAKARALYRRTRRIVSWQQARSLFDSDPVAAEVAALRDMNPTDVATAIRAMAPARLALVARAIPEEQLADLLEELPEDEQVRLLEDMDLGRVADVVEEMEPDDAADLLAAMPAEFRDHLLAALEPDDSESLARLLRYDASTAGGLMTPEPIIVSPEVSVAEVLARLRDPEVKAALAAQVFVCEPPTVTPTGRYVGMTGFQRLLREPPSRPVGACVADPGRVRPEMAEREVAERLAAYNLIAVAVCDEAGRLVGAVTVDDVLDRVLPADWRRRRG